MVWKPLVYETCVNCCWLKGDGMKVHHDTTLDYLSIDFNNNVEARSVYKDGIIVRYDQSGHVIGIDITDSLKVFASTTPGRDQMKTPEN